MGILSLDPHGFMVTPSTEWWNFAGCPPLFLQLPDPRDLGGCRPGGFSKGQKSSGVRKETSGFLEKTYGKIENIDLEKLENDD